MYADGNVLIKPDSCLSVTQIEQDLDILNKLKKVLNYTNPNYVVTDSKENRKRKYCMRIYNKKLVKGIINQGCVVNKSLILTFPTHILEELMPHFIRGYFDGDGCIWCGKPHIDKNNRFIFNTKFTFTGSVYFITGLQNYLIDKLEFKKTKLSDRKKQNTTLTLEYSGLNQCKKIYDFMYSNATIYGNRKKQKFEEIFSANRKKLRFETRLIAGNPLESNKPQNSI